MVKVEIQYQLMENSNSLRRNFSISRSGKFKRKLTQRLSIKDQNWENCENIAVKNEVKVEKIFLFYFFVNKRLIANEKKKIRTHHLMLLKMQIIPKRIEGRSHRHLMGIR